MILDHIGIATADIAASVSRCRGLYDVESVSDVLFDAGQDASLCMVRTRNGVSLEFITGAQVRGVLKKGVPYYHLGFRVDDLDAALGRLVAQGGVVASPPKPAPLFDGRRVAFVYTADGLMELVEEEKRP